jgi:hypothetical protein
MASVIMTDEQRTTDPAKVVELRPGYNIEDEQRMLHVQEPEKRCYHKRFTLEAGERRVFCADCKQPVDAFDALDYLARNVERYMHERKGALSRLRAARLELADVERQVRNAKARLRRAVKRDPVKCDCKGNTWGRGTGPWCSVCGGVKP